MSYGIRKLHFSDTALVREKILRGIGEMNEILSKTLGREGESVLIEKGQGEPLIVDDGRRAAENMKFDDPVENLAARAFYGALRKTDELAGDGTTTAEVLAHAIVKHIFENILKGGGMARSSYSVAQADKEIHEAKEAVLEKLRAMKKEVKTEKELVNVATISSGDEHIGEIIGKIYAKLGPDGHIIHQFNLEAETIEHEMIEGMRFNGAYAREWMITDPVRKIAKMVTIDVLVAHRKDLSKFMIEPLVHEMQNNGRDRLLIIAPFYDKGFLRDVYETAKKSEFAIICIKAPSAHEEQYKDIAVWTGGEVIRPEDGPEKITMKVLGYVGDMEASDSLDAMVKLSLGAGKKADVAMRINEVKGELAKTKNANLKQMKHDRISALTAGVGLIKIGGPTLEEMNWMRHKIEDAKYATKHACRDGVVPGGGLAFKKISESLPAGNILKEPLLAPWRTLKNNARGNFSVGKNVVDPLFVEETALTCACAAAAKVIRIGAAITFKPKAEIEGLMKQMVNTDGPES